MNEATRMQYLDAMGIDMFVPRFILPAAKPSTLCLLPDALPVELTVHKSTEKSPQVAGRGVMRVLDALRDESAVNRDESAVNRDELTVGSDRPLAIDHQSVVDSRVSMAANTPSEAANLVDSSPNHSLNGNNASENTLKQNQGSDDASLHQKDASSGPIQTTPNISHAALNRDNISTSTSGFASQSAQFMLSLWRANPNVLVIDAQKTVEPLPKEQLLQNILRAISVAQKLPQAEILNWPMVKNNSKDDSWLAAQEMVSYFLEGRLFTSPIEYIFVFGADAHKAILKMSPKEVCGSMILPDLGVKSLYFPSLGDILRKPKLKAHVWRTLQSDYLATLMARQSEQ